MNARNLLMAALGFGLGFTLISLVRLSEGLQSNVPPSRDTDACTADVSVYRQGDPIVGRVEYVIDGDSLCVNVGDPKNLVEVRLYDVDAPEMPTPEGRVAREIAVNQWNLREVRCTASHLSYDRVVALCKVEEPT